MTLVFWIISNGLVTTCVEILVEDTHSWAAGTHVEIIEHSTLTHVGVSTSRRLHSTF